MGMNRNVGKSINSIFGSLFKDTNITSMYPNQIKNEENQNNDIQSTILKENDIKKERVGEYIMIKTNNLKKIKISDSCVACGNCSLMTDLIVESQDGKAIPVDSGIIQENQLLKIQEVMESCAVKAISLENAGMVNSKGKQGLNELKALFNEKFSTYKIPLPNSSEYSFNRADYSMPSAYASGEYRYEYKSSDKAEQAGLKEFDRIMYSQSKAIVQQILIQYKNNKLRNFAYYEKKQGNFYHDINQSLDKVIKEFVVEAQSLAGNNLNLPVGFSEFEVNPDNSFLNSKIADGGIAYQLRHLEEVTIVDGILAKREPVSYYDTWVDYDDREDSRGKDVYCYKNISAVCNKYGEHLMSEIYYKLHSDGYTKRIIDPIFEKFNEEVQKELKIKLELFSKAIDASNI